MCFLCHCYYLTYCFDMPTLAHVTKITLNAFSLIVSRANLSSQVSCCCQGSRISIGPAKLDSRLYYVLLTYQSSLWLFGC